MFFAIFRIFLVLFIFVGGVALGQNTDNVATIELGQTSFPIERPFTISVMVPASETRANVLFPDIAGFVKKGITTSVSTSEVGEKTSINQVITQTYRALAPGRFRLPPFSITVNGEPVRSEGVTLVVLAPATASGPQSVSQSPLNVTPAGAAFLALHASKTAIYTGEGIALTLSFFVADTYPYVLDFKGLNKQLATITKKIRPANSWEENVPINELKPIPVTIKGKKYREVRLYQSVFFPLSNQSLHLPAVAIQLARPRPTIGPPTAQPEFVSFTSLPLTIEVKQLPVHPLRGRVPVGVFRLEEGLERRNIAIGQSVRYAFTVAGEGNIATLPNPVLRSESAVMDIFPPEENHSLQYLGNQIIGQKTFTYYMVPHQNGDIALANYLQWIYFDPQTARYDTLRPQVRLHVGGKLVPVVGNESLPAGVSATSAESPEAASADNSFYAGIESMDSTQQPISISVLVRSVANVLIVLMLVGMVFVFFKK